MGSFLMIIDYNWKETNQTNLATDHVGLYIICEYRSLPLNMGMGCVLLVVKVSQVCFTVRKPLEIRYGLNFNLKFEV